MFERIPAFVAAVCLSIYWAWVVVKLVRLARKIGKDPNAMPRERVGRWMRVLWYPCILLLLVGVWIAAMTPLDGRAGEMRVGAGRHVWLVAPSAFTEVAAWCATVVCVIGTILTFICWRKMGRSWRIGIDPNERLELVSTGPYRLVRHPIYALRMVINLAVIIICPTWLVLLTAGMDIALLQVEARREERYMETVHGSVYARYKNSVGRFVPRAFVG